jgi:hypothetical protein
VGAVTAIQLAAGIASQAQPAGAVTETVADPPATGKVMPAGENESVQTVAEPKSILAAKPVDALELKFASVAWNAPGEVGKVCELVYPAT